MIDNFHKTAWILLFKPAGLTLHAFRMDKMSEKKDTEAQDPLAKEIAAFQAELPKLAGEAGKFAVVFGGKVIGTFPTYQEALTKGYEVAKLEPFLVEQISSLPQVQHFSRAIGFECLTSS